MESPSHYSQGLVRLLTRIYIPRPTVGILY